MRHGSSFGDALCVSDPTGDEALAQSLPDAAPMFETEVQAASGRGLCMPHAGRLLPSGVFASHLSQQQPQRATNYSAHFQCVSVIRWIYFHLFWEVLGSAAESRCLLTGFRAPFKIFVFQMLSMMFLLFECLQM